jgi:hypothetical protein
VCLHYLSPRQILDLSTVKGEKSDVTLIVHSYEPATCRKENVESGKEEKAGSEPLVIGGGSSASHSMPKNGNGSVQAKTKNA